MHIYRNIAKWRHYILNNQKNKEYDVNLSMLCVLTISIGVLLWIKLKMNIQYKISRYCTKIQYYQGKEAWQKDRWPEVSPLSSFAAKILNIYPLSQSVTKLCRTMKHFDLQNICHYCLTCFILPFHSNLYQNEFNIIYCKVQFVSPTINNCTFPAT